MIGFILTDENQCMQTYIHTLHSKEWSLSVLWLYNSTRLQPRKAKLFHVLLLEATRTQTGWPRPQPDGTSQPYWLLCHPFSPLLIWHSINGSRGLQVDGKGESWGQQDRIYEGGEITSPLTAQVISAYWCATCPSDYGGGWVRVIFHSIQIPIKRERKGFEEWKQYTGGEMG